MLTSLVLPGPMPSMRSKLVSFQIKTYAAGHAAAGALRVQVVIANYPTKNHAGLLPHCCHCNSQQAGQQPACTVGTPAAEGMRKLTPRAAAGTALGHRGTP